MLKDHLAFTDARDMAAHYRQVKENLRKNVYVPEPKAEVQEPPPEKKVIEVEKRPTISIEPKYIEEYERSMEGLWRSGREGRANHVTMRDILKEVADKHGFETSVLMVSSRRLKVVAARHEAFYRMREELKMSYPRIAAFFGMDHTSVLHGVSKHAAKVKKENENG